MTEPLTDLSADYVREIISYSPETGEFHWKWRSDASNQVNSRRAGKRAGAKAGKRNKYLCVGVNGRSYQAHRLAWLIVTGDWPDRHIDHRDLDSLNNKWSNLRLATQSQNSANRRKHRNNTSGLKGVSWHKRIGQYVCNIGFNNKLVYLGCGLCAPALHFDYIVAQDKLFKEFARSA